MKLSKIKLATIVAMAAATAGLVACGGDPAPKATIAGASAGLNSAITSSNAGAVSGTTFNYPSAPAALPGTTGATNVTITDATTDTFVVASSAGTYSGTVSYGSCIFTVNASTVVAVPVGTVININPCNVTAGTNGVAANGTPVTLPVGLTLGAATSATQPLPVTVNSNGSVSINGAPAGTVAVVLATGG